LGISYSDQFNDKSGIEAVHEKARELGGHDHSHGMQVLTHTLETHEGTIAGRIPTGAVASSENHHFARLREKENTEKFIHAHEILQDLLRQIDAQIAWLDREIGELEKRYEEAAQRSADTFDRMHELETMLDDIESKGMTDTKRAELKQLIGEEAENVSDDVMLLELARSHMEQAQKNGIEANIEAERLQEEITAKRQVREELIRERDEIMNDSDTSPEEKAIRAQKALERSFAKNLAGAEALQQGIKTKANLRAEEILDQQRVELTEADDFDLDENMDLDAGSPPSLLGPR